MPLEHQAALSGPDSLRGRTPGAFGAQLTCPPDTWILGDVDSAPGHTNRNTIITGKRFPYNSSESIYVCPADDYKHQGRKFRRVCSHSMSGQMNSNVEWVNPRYSLHCKTSDIIDLDFDRLAATIATKK